MARWSEHANKVEIPREAWRFEERSLFPRKRHGGCAQLRRKRAFSGIQSRFDGAIIDGFL